ncbi:hypothetical protein [Halorientalis halophila]|uniref:hypothetical protein n=1 Tax=Halorientalis halophila TaxID=3108499 RepID=UPI00300BEB5A
MVRRLPDVFDVLLAGNLALVAVAAAGSLPGVGIFEPPALAAGILAFGAVAGFATTREDPDVVLARRGWHVASLAVQSLVLFGAVVWLSTQPGDPALSPSVWTLMAALVVGLAVYVVGNRRVIDRAEAAGEVRARWTASAPRRRTWVVRAVFLVAGVAVIVGGLVLHVPGAESLAAVGGFLLIWPLFVGRSREYAVLPDGLYVRQRGSYAGEFLPWSRLTGYRVTDDALVVERWIPLLAFHSKLGDLADLDAVTAALDRAFASADEPADRDPDGSTVSGTD